MFALILIGASTLTFAATGNDTEKNPAPSETTKMAVMKISPDSYKLFYVSEQEGKVKVRLYDAEGDRIFAKKINTEEGFALPYDFKNLAPGEYTFEVINADGSVLRQVVDHKDIVEKIELETLEANVQRIDNSKRFQLLVMKPNKQEVTINIMNEDGVVVHREKVNFEHGFKRTYDLSGLNGEDFTFQILNGDESKQLTTI